MAKAKKMNNETEKLLDYKQLSEATGLGIPFLKKAKDQYDLPFYKIGALVRFKVSEVEQWLKARKAC